MSNNLKKVLIIEDETEMRDILERLLSKKYEVIVSSGGRVGIELALKELPDIVICDVLMPGVTGYNVLSALRSNPTTAHIPFIFLTAKISKDDRQLGMDLGADDYLTKPFTREELFNAITACLKGLEPQ